MSSTTASGDDAQQPVEPDEQRGIVVGAASGIGQAIAERFAATTDALLLVDANPAVTELADRLGVEALVVDVRDDDAPERIVATAVERFGTPSALVNCAGVQSRGTVLDLAEDEWRRLDEINWHGVRRITIQVARAMVEGRVAGSIVHVTSLSVSSVTPGIIPYSTTKAALVQLTRGLAAEAGSHGIRVNAVAPGYIRTPMTSEVLDDPSFLAYVRRRIPLGDVAGPELVAGPVMFLLSDDARYVTGVVLAVDGGFALGAMQTT